MFTLASFSTSKQRDSYDLQVVRRPRGDSSELPEFGVGWSRALGLNVRIGLAISLGWRSSSRLKAKQGPSRGLLEANEYASLGIQTQI